LVSAPERQRPTVALPGQSVSTMHGFPLFVPEVQMNVRKAPFCVTVCPAQKVIPVTDVTLDEPVVSGFRLIGMFPTNWTHAPLGQSELVVQVSPLFVPL
jgi:hypothetical protein